jgi:hypothetical protein
MTTKNKTDRSTVKSNNVTFMTGLAKHAADVPSVSYGNETLKTADVIASLTAANAAADAAAAARTAWLARVQASHAQATETQAMVAKVKKALLVKFAGQPEVLGDFGLTERKPPTPLTTEQRAAAIAKAKATRAARKTMGSQQKKGVIGNVAGVTVTPVVEGPVAAATGSPAPARS